VLERWKKEYDVDEVMKVLVPKLSCVTVDDFEYFCFVVKTSLDYLKRGELTT